MKRRTQTVSFRADEDTLRLIDEQRKAFGISRGDWVRGVVQTHLFGQQDKADLTQLAALTAQQQEVSEGVAKLNVAMARVLFALLTQLGQLDSETAKEVVRKVLPT